MATVIVSLNTLVAAVQRSFVRSSRLLADLSAKSEAGPLPDLRGMGSPSVALAGLTLRFRCFAVTDPKDRRGTAHGLAVSLSSPSLWQRLLSPVDAYELLIAVTAGQVSVQFQCLQSDHVPVHSARAIQDWVFLLSAEQRAQILELPKVPHPPIWGRLWSKGLDFIRRGLKICGRLLQFRSGEPTSANRTFITNQS